MLCIVLSSHSLTQDSHGTGTNSYGSWSNRMVTCGEINPCVADSTNLVADQYCFVSCGAGLYGSGVVLRVRPPRN